MFAGNPAFAAVLSDSLSRQGSGALVSGEARNPDEEFDKEGPIEEVLASCLRDQRQAVVQLENLEKVVKSALERERKQFDRLQFAFKKAGNDRAYAQSLAKLRKRCGGSFYFPLLFERGEQKEESERASERRKRASEQKKKASERAKEESARASKRRERAKEESERVSKRKKRASEQRKNASERAKEESARASKRRERERRAAPTHVLHFINFCSQTQQTTQGQGRDGCAAGGAEEAARVKRTSEGGRERERVGTTTMKKTRKEKRRSNFAFRIIDDAVLLHSSEPQKKTRRKKM